jgi:uncharacterized phage protein gp47/JayE
MAELSELIVPQTLAETDATTVALVAASDMPATAWKADGVARVILGIVSELATDTAFTAAQIANGVNLELSRKGWLDLLGRSQFQDQRTAPAVTEGLVTLTDSGGGPHSVAIGALTVASAGGLRFTNTAAISLPLNGSVQVAVRAVGAGGEYNVATDSITTMVTSLPGVSVSNPAVGITDTWVTAYGADAESDRGYQKRLQAKWGTLSTGSPVSAYLYWALSTVGVSRAKVDDGNPDGPSTIRVYVDNPASVATLQATIDAKAPAGSRVTAVAATAQAVTIAATATVARGYRAQAELEALAALVELQNEIEIGGVVIKSEVIERIMSATGMIDVVIASSWTGAPNIQLGTDKIPAFTVSLAWVEQ